MPFADDVRKYTFASLDKLVSKKGELIREHPYLPTEEQLDAMDNFVDSMDLMDVGDKDQDGYDSLLLGEICLLTIDSVTVCPGLILFNHIIPQSIVSNKPCFTVQS
jgi:hypothetical protein